MFGLERLSAAARRDKDADVVVADSEYAVVSLSPSWGMLSIALAVLAMPLRFWARNLPWHPTHHWGEPLEMLAGIVGLAAGGAFFGWLGRRRGRGPVLATVGLFLNLAVVGVLVIFVGGLAIYFRLLR